MGEHQTEAGSLIAVGLVMLLVAAFWHLKRQVNALGELVRRLEAERTSR